MSNAATRRRFSERVCAEATQAMIGDGGRPVGYAACREASERARMLAAGRGARCSPSGRAASCVAAGEMLAFDGVTKARSLRSPTNVKGGR